MPSENLSEKLFSCQNCGDCCRGYGGTYVTASDIDRIAAFLGLPAETIIGEYCALSGSRYVIRQRSDGYCIFWNRLCTIHPVKPRMCRAWPFIEAVVRDPSNWSAMARSCPGMRPDADPAELIRCARQQIAECDKVRQNGS